MRVYIVQFYENTDESYVYGAYATRDDAIKAASNLLEKESIEKPFVIGLPRKDERCMTLYGSGVYDGYGAHALIWIKDVIESV